MNVFITGEAREDLDRIAAYIAQDNPARAVSFIQELLEGCRSLSAMPHAFPLVPRYGASGIRRRKHGNYLIFYRAASGRIDILHILNAAQDYEAILFPER